MPKNRSLLTDEQWEHICPFIPERASSPKGGRPPTDDRNRPSQPVASWAALS
jgi:transposase